METSNVYIRKYYGGITPGDISVTLFLDTGLITISTIPEKLIRPCIANAKRLGLRYCGLHHISEYNLITKSREVTYTATKGNQNDSTA